MLLAFLTLYSTALLPLPDGYGSELKFIHGKLIEKGWVKT